MATLLKVAAVYWEFEFFCNANFVNICCMNSVFAYSNHIFCRLLSHTVQRIQMTISGRLTAATLPCRCCTSVPSMFL